MWVSKSYAECWICFQTGSKPDTILSDVFVIFVLYFFWFGGREEKKESLCGVYWLLDTCVKNVWLYVSAVLFVHGVNIENMCKSKVMW